MRQPSTCGTSLSRRPRDAIFDPAMNALEPRRITAWGRGPLSRIATATVQKATASGVAGERGPIVASAFCLQKSGLTKAIIALENHFQLLVRQCIYHRVVDSLHRLGRDHGVDDC